MLLEPLNPSENEQFHEYLESALQGQNASLLEEKAALEIELKRELAEKEALEKRLEQERIAREKEKARADEAEQLLRQKEKERTTPRLNQKEDLGQSLEEINREKQAREEAEKRAKEEASARAKAERKVEIYAITSAITMSLVLVGLFQSLIYRQRPRKPRPFKAGMNGPTLWGVMGWVLSCPLTSVLLCAIMHTCVKCFSIVSFRIRNKSRSSTRRLKSVVGFITICSERAKPPMKNEGKVFRSISSKKPSRY